ncbi:MAG TPA: HAMP domain-containing sensor histidine kinase [Vineibacter sp.]|nr:HAMP domain-containing sensor histidine kinase [Vineibacter sp.]
MGPQRAGIAFWWILATASAILLLLGGIALSQRLGTSSRERDSATARDACDGIAQAYKRIPLMAPTREADILRALIEARLRDADGIEGGIWDSRDGFIAYAYPTYEGTDVKRDVPAAEQARIGGLAAQALGAATPRVDVRSGTREAIILAACPLNAERVAWTMLRAPVTPIRAVDRLLPWLLAWLAVVTAACAWAGWRLVRQARAMARVETAMASGGPTADEPLPTTGLSDIDAFVTMLNTAGHRLETARADAGRLATQLARAEHLSAIGRMAAGLAHEIRNPVGAMRLRAENALAAGGDAHVRALNAVLEQLARLDTLVSGLLAMAQPFQIKPGMVDTAGWVQERYRLWHERYQAAGIALDCGTDVAQAVFDSAQLARVADNLLLNAVQNTPSCGHVVLRLTRQDDRLILRVVDSGPGIALAVRDRLFEPFVTGRPSGTGLGLALVREIAVAHQGNVRLVPSETGAIFEVDLPWRAS